MDSKGGIQSYETPVAHSAQGHYRKSADLHEHSSNSIGMDGRGDSSDNTDPVIVGNGIHSLERKKPAWYAYMTTKDFWIVLLLGQVLALCITATNTFSGLLVQKGTSIPAFQTMGNYVLLALTYGSYTIYKYGFKKYFKLMFKDGWKYIILAFFDVEGNYCTVLAYRYTNVLSAQLINFWAIVVVVIISFFILKVRYRWTQVAGIIVCIGGMGVLISSDHITGANGMYPENANKVKGDLFAALGATFYGLTNIFEEWLVSKRPLYEVIGMIGFFGVIINGVTAAIFDRHTLLDANWDGQIAGYLVGFTLVLVLFYSLAPIMFRMASAAFFNISLLTASFWGVAIGVSVFGYKIHFMYPIAFVLIILGLITYFTTGGPLGESKKPWLGENQEHGISGVGTAKRKAINEATRENIVSERDARV